MKHNFRLSLFTMAMLALSSTAQAQQISMEDAQTIAQQWLTRGEKNSNVKLAAHPVTLAHTMKSATDNATNIYVFNRDKHGFVIIAGDERVERQILGFCDDGEFNPDIMPDALRDLMGAYNEQIDIIKKVEPEVSHNGKGPKMSWDGQIRPQFHDVHGGKGPLLTTYWIQDSPYNWEVARKIAGVQNPEGMTETELDGKKVPPTGCVITALAQIMNYHEWPVKGTGSFTYKEYRGCHSDPDNGTDISSNFSEHTYDWAHMRDEYEGTYSSNAADGTKGIYNKVEGNAVAQLMYDIGVSLRTRYGRNATHNSGKESFSGTGGSEYDITTALVKYFGYASTVKARARGNISGQSTSNYTDKEWEEMLVNEIDNNRPVFMTGAKADNSESHAYVCDGYAYGNNDNKLYFHVNWGWGKYGNGPDDDEHHYMFNGYFLSTAFTYHTPYYPEGDKDYKEYEWAYKQYAIIGIQPDKGDYWYDWTNYADNARGMGGTYKHTEKQPYTNKDVTLQDVYGRLSRDGKYREIKVGDWGKGPYSTNGVEAHFIIDNETGEVVTHRFYTGWDYQGQKIYASSPEESPLYNSYWTPSQRTKSKLETCDWKGQYGFVSQDGVFVKALTLNIGYYYEKIDSEKRTSYSVWNTTTAPDVLKLQPLQYTTTVSSANIATLCLDYNAWLPLKSETDRIKAYYVTDNKDGTVKFNKLEGSIIPQGVPVIIQAEEGDWWFQESVTDEPTDVIKGNLLKGTIDAHQFTDEELRNVYFLQVRDSSPVFLKAKKNSDSAKMTIGAHKAWLEYDGGTNAPTQLLTDGFASDIQRLIDDADMGNAKRYNLAGQQVGNSYHGIIIVNGKKYLR
ncbi:MAG: C10 family peptidase [Prevotellaceae bacterium]|nr:C10 family peptidase [Candidatus Colivivens caballi]